MRAGRDPRESSSVRAIDEEHASAILRAVQAPPEESGPLAAEELRLLRADLQVAKHVQAKLLPERVPKISGYDFDAYYAPAGELGGDLYDFLQFDKNHLGILVADASGKGLSGALLMVEARAVVRSMASLSVSPVQVLCQANRVLFQDFKRGTFISMYYAILDISKSVLTVASAGHMPMLLWRWKEAKCYAVNPSGLVLGTATEEVFRRTLKETSVELEPGDRFVLYTDGVTEHMNTSQEEFGRSRFVGLSLKSSRRSSAEYIHDVVSALAAYRDTATSSDDVTVVTGRRIPEQMW